MMKFHESECITISGQLWSREAIVSWFFNRQFQSDLQSTPEKAQNWHEIVSSPVKIVHSNQF